MGEDRSIDHRILGGKLVLNLQFHSAIQNRFPQRDQLGTSQEPGPNLPKTCEILFNRFAEKRRYALELLKPASIKPRPGNLPALIVQGELELPPIPLAPYQRLVRLHQTVGRYREPHAFSLASQQDVFAKSLLFLQEGKLKNEVRLDVDVHAAAG